MLEFVKVSKDLSGKRILEDLSFRVRKGAVFGLLGPNGAGKTTSIRLLSGLWKPTSGVVRVAGIDMTVNPLAGRQLLGLVPSEISLYSDLTTLENVELISGLYGNNKGRREWIQQLLLEMALWEVRHTPASKLSKGMKQKVAIVRALVHNPKVLILDEPTSALDLASTHAVESFIETRRRTGITTLLCTHDIYQALRLCDEILVLNEGRVFWEGLRSEVESADWLMDLVIRARGERRVGAGDRPFSSRR